MMERQTDAIFTVSSFFFRSFSDTPAQDLSHVGHVEDRTWKLG